MTTFNIRFNIVELIQSFFDFFEEKNLGEWNFSNKTNNVVFEFTMNDFHNVANLNIVYNGVDGGLVLGNSHIQGGIHLIQPDLNRNIL